MTTLAPKAIRANMEEDDLEFDTKEKHSRRRKQKFLKDSYKKNIEYQERDANPYKRDKHKIVYIPEEEDDE